MDKPGSWFLLAKCLKNTCGRVLATAPERKGSQKHVLHLVPH